MFDKLKQKIIGTEVQKAGFCAPIGQTPNERSIYQSREIFGVNFGSLFVLEKYIYGELFIDDTTVELDAIKLQVKNSGVEETRKGLESHWNNYMNDGDWDWLKSKGVNSVRIPIGYWHVSPKFTHGTHFECVKDVYVNAWDILKEKFIKKAAQYQISVLVDFHGLPSGANTGDHSGEKLKTPGFWGDSHAMKLAVEVCTFISTELKGFDNISGIQIVNEASFDNEAKYQKRYYFDAINSIRSAGWEDIPIVISDGWWADQWVQIFDKASHGDIGSLGVVIDDHVYRCFSDEDKCKDINRIIGELPSNVLTGLSKPMDFIIGEYSCVIDGQSWDRSNGDRDQKVIEYGQTQSRLFRERSMGSYFWTFKFQWGDGGEWGFVPMVNRGAIPTRSITPNRIPDEGEFNRVLDGCYNSHCNYWQSQSPGTKYEHWRFKDGFTTGWFDCMAFLQFGNSKIGRLVSWQNSRKMEHINARGESQYIWQWEHGFNEAVGYFRGV